MLSIESVHSDVIPMMVRRIVEEFHPLKIILFGSYARGDAGRSSDVDLLVVLNYVDDEHQETVEIRRVLSDFPVPKDIVVATLDELAGQRQRIGTILRQALLEGKVLFERD